MLMTFREKLRLKTVHVIFIECKGTAFKENGEIWKNNFSKKQ